MAFDKRYLKKHGNQWLVVIKVPERLRKAVGKAHLKHPLHTDSLAVANREKFRVVATLKDELLKAEAEMRRKAKEAPDPLADEAMQWREAVQQSEADPSFYAYEDDEGNLVEDGHGLTLSLVRDRAEEIAVKEGVVRAKDFHDVATGQATPINRLIDKWLAERPMKPRQQVDYRRAVDKFAGWLAATRLPASIEAVTRRIAGRYVTDVFVTIGTHPKTANKDISCLSSLWKWAETKGFVTENIWRGQSLAKRAVPKDEQKRPYTDDEMRKLFYKGQPGELLSDFMHIAALSGMRVDEIARLNVGNVVDDCFDIIVAKTEAGVRMVPIHPGLKAIVARRTEGKEEKYPLFPELPVPKKGSAVERSQKVVKAFTAYRRKMEVDDVPDGARQSRVDFHSFRRWFITKAEQAERLPHFIEAVVGHKRLGMSLGGYSGGPLREQFRAVVESVELPSPDSELAGKLEDASSAPERTAGNGV